MYLISKESIFSFELGFIKLFIIFNYFNINKSLIFIHNEKIFNKLLIKSSLVLALVL